MMTTKLDAFAVIYKISQNMSKQSGIFLRVMTVGRRTVAIIDNTYKGLA
jgi:hypothetical protein